MENITRRKFIQASAVLAAAHSLLPKSALAASTGYTLPSLPYDYTDLEPFIDAETMKLHHDKHHQGYIDRLNEQVSKLPALKGLSLESIVREISKYTEAVRNNAGGHYNHSFFWTTMAPKGKGGEPSAELKAKIDSDFGSIEMMKNLVNGAALTRFGSGWGWLVLKKDKKLSVLSTPYQDSPIMDVVAGGTPLIAIDVWEHAYYLKYQNRRGEYLTNWWKVVNWNEINKRYSAAL